MKNTISISENKLTLNGSNEIIFDEEVCDVVDMEEVVVVLTMPRKGFITVNRIYGVIDGEITWQVQDMLEFNPNYSMFAPDPYKKIKIYGKNPELIIATSAYGHRFLINPHNGKIVGTESWVK